MDLKLQFSGNVFNGDVDLVDAELVSVPSKPHYACVDIAVKTERFNIGIMEVTNSDLPFDEKKKLGAEVARRWNRVAELEHALVQVMELAKRESPHFGGPRKDIQERIKEVVPDS